MKSLGSSLTKKGIKNMLLNFQGILCQKQILDKPRLVKDYHFCRSLPKIRKNPQLCGLAKRVVQMLGCQECAVVQDLNIEDYLSGSKVIDGAIPICHNYCGYQFGVWAGQLGDGRAHTIGHIENNGKIYQLQLKGSGLSPFSRQADGNCVVSSAVREFLASELMAGISIPTSRALSLVITDEQVIRDPFYNGIVKIQKAAVVVRVAESFLRFGSFEVCNKGANLQKQKQLDNRNILAPLANYLLQYFYKDIQQEQGDVYEQLFKKIVIKSAELVAQWQTVGFVHGVLNTDNMSMICATIDYGPFGFIDYFSKDYVSNATDQHQRYSYRQQPAVVKWNLMRLAEAFDVLVPFNILKRYIDELFDVSYQNMYDLKMAEKLGLQLSQQSKQIVAELFDVMHICGSNFTNTFRILSQVEQNEKLIKNILRESLPTQYYKRNLRIISNMNISQEQINSICLADQGFNRSFLSQQGNRRNFGQMLKSQSCQNRTAREKQLWEKWLKKYQKLKRNRELQTKNTLKYVLLNQIAKNITEELITLKPQQQRILMNKILDVFANPYQKNQWFQNTYWSKRPIPVRLTCSS